MILRAALLALLLALAQPAAVWAAAYSDAFTAPNGGLGASWATNLDVGGGTGGAITIVSNRAEATATDTNGNAFARFETALSTTNQIVIATVAVLGAGDRVGLVARMADPGTATFYNFLYAQGGGNAVIDKWESGSRTELASAAMGTFSAGDKLMFVVNGTSLQGWKLVSGIWTQVVSVTNGDITTGTRAGVYAQFGSALDDWSANDIGIHRASGSAVANSTTTTLTLAAPAGVLGEDMLVATILMKATTQTITPPNGWTERALLDNGPTMRSYVFTKQATGTRGAASSDASANFAFTKGTDDNLLWFGVISDFGYVTAVDATTPSESANASSDDVTYATFTPTSEAVLIVLSGTYADDQTTAGSVSGSNPTLTNRVDVETNAGTDGSIFVYEGADFGKTATGSRTHATTSTNNAVNNGIVLGLTHEAPIAVVRGGPPTRSLLGVGLCCCCCSGHSGSLSSRRSRRRTRT